MDLQFSELYISGVKFAYVSVDYSVCSACCVFDGVGEGMRLLSACVWWLFVTEGDSVVVSLAIFFIFSSPYV